MARTVSCLALALCLALAPEAVLAQGPVTDPEVGKGIKLVDDGDYDGAILTLDNAARRLATDPSKSKDLSQAYLYLGIAYVGKGHEAAAKAKFREALGQIKDLTLSPDKFAPKIIDVFEAARQEAGRSAAAPAKKKGGHGKAILIGGVVVAGAVAGIAIAAGGGSKEPVDDRRVDTFTGSLCGDTSICENERGYDIVVSGDGTLDATVTWTDPNIFYEMGLDDENFNTVAHSNRINQTSSALTAQVSVRTSSPSAAYHLFIGRPDSAGAVPFTLTVRHP